VRDPRRVFVQPRFTTVTVAQPDAERFLPVLSATVVISIALTAGILIMGVFDLL